MAASLWVWWTDFRWLANMVAFSLLLVVLFPVEGSIKLMCLVFSFGVDVVVEGSPELFTVSGVHPGYFSLDPVVLFLC